MKTLEETIDGLKICFDSSKYCEECPYEKHHNIDSVIPLCIDMLTQDAIYYLKFFKDYSIRQKELSDKLLQKMQQMKLVQNLVEVDNKEENPPLTWDELKDMAGQPVWVEWTVQREWRFGDWNLIHALTDEIELVDVYGNISIVSKEFQDVKWRAYRKKRK